MTTKKATTEDAQPPAPQADSVAPAAPAANPPAGGQYTYDPATGVYTLVTPSTIQE